MGRREKSFFLWRISNKEREKLFHLKGNTVTRTRAEHNCIILIEGG